MKKRHDLLSKEFSPQKLTTDGVKRVNNLPLFIAIGVVTVFVVLIALVTQKRANAQNHIAEPVKIKKTNKNTMSLAHEVVGNRKAGTILAFNDSVENNQAPPLTMPPPQKDKNIEPIQQGISDNEIERIRQEKTQAFEEAVKAKTAIRVDNLHLMNGSEPINHQANQDIALNVDVSNTFKEQLNFLQQKQKSKPMPQTLGGQENESRWHLNSHLENPNSRYELRASGVIPGVMISGISSELPGQIIGQVSQNVYDTATGKFLLIPQGTKLVGIYSSDVGFGQNSVLVA